MPKCTHKTPISGLFGVIKPSGTVTMQMLNSLNDLLASSPLFKAPETSTPKGRKQRWKAARVKLGQGGTLDPLAQGVVGRSRCSYAKLPHIFASSRGCQ
jgi:tRNA pseudouridine55 synthase